MEFDESQFEFTTLEEFKQSEAFTNNDYLLEAARRGMLPLRYVQYLEETAWLYAQSGKTQAEIDAYLTYPTYKSSWDYGYWTSKLRSRGGVSNADSPIIAEIFRQAEHGHIDHARSLASLDPGVDRAPSPQELPTLGLMPEAFQTPWNIDEVLDYDHKATRIDLSSKYRSSEALAGFDSQADLAAELLRLTEESGRSGVELPEWEELLFDESEFQFTTWTEFQDSKAWTDPRYLEEAIRRGYIPQDVLSTWIEMSKHPMGALEDSWQHYRGMVGALENPPWAYIPQALTGNVWAEKWAPLAGNPKDDPGDIQVIEGVDFPLVWEYEKQVPLAGVVGGTTQGPMTGQWTMLPQLQYQFNQSPWERRTEKQIEVEGAITSEMEIWADKIRNLDLPNLEIGPYDPADALSRSMRAAMPSVAAFAAMAPDQRDAMFAAMDARSRAYAQLEVLNEYTDASSYEGRLNASYDVIEKSIDAQLVLSLEKAELDSQAMAQGSRDARPWAIKLAEERAEVAAQRVHDQSQLAMEWSQIEGQVAARQQGMEAKFGNIESDLKWKEAQLANVNMLTDAIKMMFEQDQMTRQTLAQVGMNLTEMNFAGIQEERSNEWTSALATQQMDMQQQILGFGMEATSTVRKQLSPYYLPSNPAVVGSEAFDDLMS